MMLLTIARCVLTPNGLGMPRTGSFFADQQRPPDRARPFCDSQGAVA